MIAFRAAGAGTDGLTATLTPPLPAGTSAGDFLVAVVAFTSAAWPPPTISSPGWTLWGYANSRLIAATTGRNVTTYLFYKFAAGGESDPVFTTSSTGTPWGVVLAGYTGVDTTDPIEQNSLGSVAKVATATLPVRLPETRSDNTVMVTVFGGDGNAFSPVLSPDAGFTLRVSTNGVTDVHIGLADIAVPSQGSITEPTWSTVSSGAQAALSFSMRAAGEAANAAHQIRLADSTLWYSGTATTSTGIALLPKSRAGDLIVLDLFARTNTGGTFTVTGFTRASTQIQTFHLHEVWYRLADGTETATLTITYSTATTGIGIVSTVFSDVDPTVPLDGVTPTLDQNTGTLMQMPAITTATDGAVVYTSLWTPDDNEDLMDTPNGFSTIAEGDDFDWGTAGSHGSAYKNQTTAGAVTGPLFRQTISAGDTWTGQAMSLRLGPAETPPDPPVPGPTGRVIRSPRYGVTRVVRR